MTSEIALAEVRNWTLDTVELITNAGDALRFHVFDPTIYTSEPELDITFFGVHRFEQSGRLSDVRLRETALPHEFSGFALTAFEFVSREIRPTQGRPYQAEILEDGSGRILFGQEIEHRRALIVAERVAIVQSPAERSD